jgi:excisionase family DNA binding protein
VKQARFPIDGLVEALADAIGRRLEGRLPTGGDTLAPRLLSVEALAKYLGRSRVSVQHLIATEAFPVVRADRRVFIDRQDVDAWIERNKDRKGECTL